jgi:hypothetical protein
MILSLIKLRLAPYLTAIVAGGFLAVAATAGIFYWQWSRALTLAETRLVDNDRLKGQVLVHQTIIKDQQHAIEVLGQTSVELNEHVLSLNTLLTEIRNAPPAEDGPVAPVLLNTLRRIDGMRRPVVPKGRTPR